MKEAQKMVWRICGSEVEEGAKFCTKCGNPIARKNSVPILSEPLPAREKIFRQHKNSGLIYLILLIVMVLAAAFSFYSFYENRDNRLFLLGILCIALALQKILSWFARSKVKLNVGRQMVSGTTVKMLIIPQKFEYVYDEISEVTNTLGLLQIRANGKWVVIPGIADRKGACRILKERMTGV